MYTHQVAQQFAKINLLNISTVELTKWIREHMKLSLRDSLHVAYLVKDAHKLGEVRGRALK